MTYKTTSWHRYCTHRRWKSLCVWGGLTAKAKEAHVFDLMDPKAFWLTVTNVGLGILTLASCLVLAHALFHDVFKRIRDRSHHAP